MANKSRNIKKSVKALQIQKMFKPEALFQLFTQTSTSGKQQRDTQSNNYCDRKSKQVYNFDVNMKEQDDYIESNRDSRNDNMSTQRRNSKNRNGTHLVRESKLNEDGLQCTNFMHRLTNLNRYKVTVANQNIKKNGRMAKQDTLDTKFAKKGSNSLQIPIKMMGKGPQNLTSQLFASSNKNKQDIRGRERQKSFQSYTYTSTSKASNKVMPRQKIEEFENNYHNENMRKLQEHLSQQKLEKRLSTFSKESGKNSIRVYKDDIHKLIVNRFNKDRITTFLDTEYIEDFNSVLKTINQLVRLKKQQMLVFSFLIVDQNKDGLITAEDLTSLLGVRDKSASTHNPLILNDILKIYQYIQVQKQKGDPVFDKCNNPILKDECLTFMKYRINNYRQKKHEASGENERKYFLSVRLHPHLYSLRDESKEDQMNRMQTSVEKGEQKLVLTNILMKFLGGGPKKFAKYECTIGQNKKFSIGFQRYCQIFNYDIPKVFLDFLFLLGGLEVTGQNYLKVDTSILEEPVVQQKVQEQKIDMMAVTHRRLREMTQLKKYLRMCRMKTQP